MPSYRTIARLTGSGYLIIFITGFFSNFLVLEGLVDFDSAAITMNNIAEQQTQFRIGFVSFFIMVIVDLLLAWTLYLLLKPVNKNLSLLSGWLRVVNAAIFGIALFHLLSVLKLSGGDDYLTAFSPEQLQAQIMLMVNAFNHTWLIGLVFFGLHLLLLGYLIYKADFIPKILGIFLIIAGFGYLIDSFAHFLLINYQDYKDFFLMIVLIPGVIGELSLTIWLLVKAGKLPEIPETV